jgi:hypothetical protein
MEILTDREIREDIHNFEKRISTAREKLAMLPGGQLPFPEHKKREKQRREMQADIQHVQKLIGYAAEAFGEHACAWFVEQDRMGQAAKAKGWSPGDHNETDAIPFLEFGLKELGE